MGAVEPEGERAVHGADKVVDLWAGIDKGSVEEGMLDRGGGRGLHAVSSCFWVQAQR